MEEKLTVLEAFIVILSCQCKCELFHSHTNLQVVSNFEESYDQIKKNELCPHDYQKIVFIDQKDVDVNTFLEI